MLTREDYRQLAERCALLAGECGAPGVAEALRALALDYLARGVQARSNNRRSDFPDKFVTHPAPGKNECRCRQTALNPILNARERRESAISSADQLR